MIFIDLNQGEVLFWVLVTAQFFRHQPKQGPGKKRHADDDQPNRGDRGKICVGSARGHFEKHQSARQAEAER